MGCCNKSKTGCDITVNFMVTLALVMMYFTYPSEWTKIMPIMWLALNCGSDTYGSLIGYGLAISSLGDIALEMDRTDPKLFMAGLVFFLIAHILYIQAFLIGCVEVSVVPVLFSVSYYACIMQKLIPLMQIKEPNMIIPVAGYGLAILLMIGTAATRAFSYHLGISNKSKLYAVVGAALFVASDTIIAMDKFADVIPDAKFYVMVTYYLGQTLIAASAWPVVAAACPFCSGLTNCQCCTAAKCK